MLWIYAITQYDNNSDLKLPFELKYFVMITTICVILYKYNVSIQLLVGFT